MRVRKISVPAFNLPIAVPISRVHMQYGQIKFIAENLRKRRLSRAAVTYYANFHKSVKERT